MNTFQTRTDILFWIFSCYVFMMLIFGRQFSYIQFAPKVFITEILIIFFILMLMARGIIKRRSEIYTTFDIYVILYFIFGLFFLILSLLKNGVASLRGWIPFYFYSNFYFIMLNVVGSRLEYLKKFIYIGLAGVIGSMIYRIFRIVTHEFILFNTSKGFGESATCLYASFLIFFSIPLIDCVKKHRFVLIILIGINSFLTLLSTARGAILSFLIAFVAYCLLDKKTRIVKNIVGIVPFLLLFFLIFYWAFDLYSNDYINDRYREFLTIFSSDVPNAPAGTRENAAWRKVMWMSLVKHTLEGKIFLGNLFGTPVRVFTLKKIYAGAEDVIQPHNSFIHLFFRTGIIGISSMLAIIFVFIKRMYKGFITESNLNKRLYLSIMCVFIYYLVNASFNVVLEGPYMGVFFWIIIGLGILIEEFDKRSIKII